jgi:hypothetical protein
MHTFLQKPVKRLKMRRLTRAQTGNFRYEMINLLACTPDPFSSVIYAIDIGPCKEQAKAIGSAAGRHITLTPVIIKLLGHAIAAHPVFNQMIFNSSLYQLEDIAIANLTLIPGTDTVTNIIFTNPHEKSLAAIQQELFSGIAQAKTQIGAPPHALVSLLSNVCYRFGLFRLIGERRAFAVAYERGLISNIGVSIHLYASPANFIMVKDVIPPMNMSPRIHVCGPMKKPVFEDDLLVAKDIIQLHVTTDHRIIDGVHAYEFGQTLAKISTRPEDYFS